MPTPEQLDRELSELSLEDQVATFDEILKHHDFNGMRKIGNFGIAGLDKYTGGMYEGELITISGLTKNGKTLLAQSITRNLIHHDNTVGWFTFEVPPAQFLETFRDDPEAMKYGILPIEHRAGNLKWLFTRIAEMHVTWSTRVFVIDHLHFLFDMWSTKNVSLGIGQVVRALKHLCVVGGFCIMLLCHYSKGQKEENEDSYENIRDSSLIAQESDSVFLVRRIKNEDGEYGNEASVSVEFHRRTGEMKRRVWLSKHGKFLFESAAPPEQSNGKKKRGGYGYGD